jgi:hypothetical protein
MLANVSVSFLSPPRRRSGNQPHGSGWRIGASRASYPREGLVMRGWTGLLLAAALAWPGGAAAAKAAEPRPAHYDIKARIDPVTDQVTSEVAITLPPSETGRSTAFVISARMKLGHVSAPGARMRIEPTDKPTKGLSRLIFDFERPPTRPVTLRFSYSGPLGLKGEGRMDPKQAMEVGFEDFWVPVRPNFNLLFTADADISGIPADAVAVAQGKVSRRGDHLIIHRAFVDLDMPFAAMTGLKRSSAPMVELYARNPDGVLESAYRKHAGSIAAFYTKLFGPLPPEALPTRLVVLPRTGAAYERRAYISIPDGSEELKKIGPVAEWMLLGTVAHEFSHGWWWRADPLTEDHWLNESLAEYSSMRFTEAEFGADPLRQRLDRKVEPSKSAGPVIGKGRPSRNALYQKGPLLLFGLDQAIGRPKVDALMRAIGARPPRTTSEFLAVLASVAGAEAARDFEAKLRAP